MRKYIEVLVLALSLGTFSVAFGYVSYFILMAQKGHGADAFAILMAGTSGVFLFSTIVMPVLYWRDNK